MKTRLFFPLAREEGMVFISFVLFILLLMIGVGALYAFSFADYRAAFRSEITMQAIYTAEAGIDQKLVQLMQRDTANITGNLNFDTGGTYLGQYQVFYGIVATNPQSGIKSAVNPNTGEQRTVTEYANGDEVVISTGIVLLNGAEQTRRVLRATIQQSGLVNPRATVTISGVASTNGAVIVDGREHDVNGNLTGSAGTFGISTSSNTFLQGGNSKVGGNGIAPANPANPATYEINAPPLPNTPEEVLGMNPGSLDQFKTSNPPQTPFNGVVYLTSSWDAVNLDGSSGILICHNQTGDAFLKNLHGLFKGLIITDDIIHINGDSEIIGAVYGLKTGGVTLGNGSGEVKFSTAELSTLPLARYVVTSWEDGHND